MFVVGAVIALLARTTGSRVDVDAMAGAVQGARQTLDVLFDATHALWW